MTDSAAIATAITTAPAWCLVSLTMPDADLRERGAEELARWITSRIGGYNPTDARQLPLPFA